MINNIDNITIFMTDNCNMRCKYCFEKKNGYNKNNIKNEDIESLLKLFDNNINPLSLNLFGGEPTINPKGIYFIFECLKKYDLLISEICITTNLFHLNKELMNFLNNSKYNITVTVSCILNEEEHNRDRVSKNNNGTYSKIYENLIFCLENYKNIRFTTHSVVSKNNIKNITKIIDSTLEFKNKYQHIKNSFALVSTNSNNDGSDIYSKDELKYYYEDYLTRDKEKYKNINWSDIYFPIVPSFSYIYNKELVVCRVFKTEITLLTNGCVVPCHRIIESSNKDKHIRHINEFKSLNEVEDFLKIPDNLYDDQVELISENGNYYCKNCVLNSICNTCVIGSYNKTNNYLIKSKEECLRTMTVAELTMEYERIKLMKEQNELLKTLIEKVDNLGNLNINIAEGVQMLLNSKIEINEK